MHQSSGNQIKALAADSQLRLEAEGLGPVGEEVRAGNLALDQDGMAGAFPADGVGHFAADAGLLGEHYSAAVAAQPVDGFFDELGVSHGCGFRTSTDNRHKSICIRRSGPAEVTDSLPAANRRPEEPRFLENRSGSRLLGDSG